MRHHNGARATNASMLANAREHHYILNKIERRLAAEGRVTSARQRRLAQYYYRELRVLCLNDRAAFDAAVAQIFTLDRKFQPGEAEPQKLMRVLGLRDAIRLHSAIKRAAGR